MKNRIRRILRIGLLLGGTLAVAATCVFLYLQFMPRPTPAGQPALVRLNSENVRLLIERFNSQGESQTVLLMLSPTCGVCLAGASALQQVLLEHPKAKVNVIVIWEPVLGIDIAPPSASKLARLSDSRVAQFWDGGLLVSDKLLQSARAHPERLNEEQRQQLAHAEVVWDFVAVFPAGTRWDEPENPPFPDFSGAPVVDVIDEVRKRIGNASSEINGP